MKWQLWSRAAVRRPAGGIVGLVALGAFAMASSASGAAGGGAAVLWLEAERFAETGGWSNDSQFVDIMGSPYLLATGLGKPVADAVTTAKVPRAGAYRLWVRCKDWLPSHSPGRFVVHVGGKPSAAAFGKAARDAWQWVDGGAFDLPAGEVEVRLRDETGWWGRCDAVVLASGRFRPADDPAKLAAQRLRYGGVSPEAKATGPYDVVVIGGGPAGCGAAIAAARHGCKVALIQDRPVLGGNASSEIQVPPMGYLGSPPDRINVTGLADELFGEQGWRKFADSKHIERVVRAERRLSLWLNTRATGVAMAARDRIGAVIALDVRSGQRRSFAAPLFIDCTGHGWVGCYAGADYRMGQEARGEFNESLAPVEPGTRTMGNSLYKAVFREHRAKAAPEGGAAFHCPAWAYQWTKASDFEPRGSHRRLSTITRPPNFDSPSRGRGRNPGDDPDGATSHAWWVEYGGMLNTIDDAEKIRDELFRISLGLWNYAKNHNPRTVEKNRYRELVWLNYVPGVRESRRLLGDYVMTQREYDERIVHADTIAFTDWGPDLHHPEGFWVKGNDCIHVYKGRRTSIPYRTLYSRNIANLLMAGRCHSATHVALGGTRVMRPMCQTGQAAGTAAAIARRYRTTPRGVYRSHLAELQQALLKDGCYLLGVPNGDQRDRALGATASASTAAAGAAPGNVINGWSRRVGKARNAWAPAAKAPGPHWVRLDFDAAVTLDAVHVTFEARSAACAVAVPAGEGWTTVASIPAGGARRHVVRFQPVEARSLRLTLTGRAADVGVCEVRAYHEAAAAETEEPAPAETYTNPVAGDVRMGDPFAVRFGRTYYLTGTTDAGRGFRLWSSANLVDWTPRGFAYQRGPAAWGQRSFWAPELFAYRGRHYLVYSASRKDADGGKPGLRICLASADAPAGPYRDVHAPWCDPGYSCIDGHVFVDEDGAAYLYFAKVGVVDKPQRKLFGEIHAVKLKADLSGPVGQPVLCTKADQPWETPPAGRSLCNEGAFVFRRGDRYYMTYSANHYAEAFYGIGWAAAASPLGPWRKPSRTPLVSRDESLGVSGPGHCSITTSPDGRELFCVYHAHADPARPSGKRTVNIDRLTITPAGRLKLLGPTRSPQPLPSGATRGTPSGATDHRR